jgi:hypothetical protein
VTNCHGSGFGGEVDKAAAAKYSWAMTDDTQAEQELAVSPLVARAEAARYALLRRLAPSMRHHLVVNLQPIGMIYDVMERRLRSPEPDLSHVQESAQKINGFARAALSSCLDVVTWLAPDEDAGVSGVEGVRECVGLLATSLSFRGYALRNEVTELPGKVQRAAIRNVLTAALIHATDEYPPPADLMLTATAADEGLRLVLALRLGDGDRGFTQEAGYRQLGWDDVQALAAAESVTLKRDAGTISLTVPWAQAATAS